MLAPDLKIPPSHRQSADDLATRLVDARRRSLALMDAILETRELGPQLAIVNPPLWELGHVGFFHEIFALRALYGIADTELPQAERWFDSSSIPHSKRWELALASRAAILDYLARVQQAMLERLPDGGLASEAQSYVYQLTSLHEDMHGEAFIYTRQTLGDLPPVLNSLSNDNELLALLSAGPLPGDVDIPGGHHWLGSDESVPFRFDNEKPPTEVEVAPFSIARAPVTNGEFATFVEQGGYLQAEFWSRAGGRWREQEEATGPIYWRRGKNGAWEERQFNSWQPLAPHRPVAHINFYEAEAWCRWAGRRLPSEAEWEVAASRVQRLGDKSLAPVKRRYPWGQALPDRRRANLDALWTGTVDVAALSEGDSAFGCRQMLGNVWEWTATRFGPFPGFRADLYQDYSEPWFQEGRCVLRGGAWATRRHLIHNGYRNFFTPERRDILAGFRTCPL